MNSAEVCGDKRLQDLVFKIELNRNGRIALRPIHSPTQLHDVPRSRRLRDFVLLAVLAMGLSGCSTFNRDWREAAKHPTPTNGIAGRWEGSWKSDANGHHGRLRCLVSQAGDGKLNARFHANYKRILSFGYTVPLEVKETNGQFQFQGSADLGRLAGGEYRYEGRASPTNFFSRYSAARDHGTFEMTRP